MASRRIFYYLPDSANPFWGEVVAGIERKLAGFGFTLQTFSAGHDQALQTRQMSECMQLRPEGVFISPVEMAPVAGPCKAIIEAGIPAIAIDQTMTGNAVANVIAGNMKGGYLAAQHLASCLTAGKKIVHVQAENLPNVVLRSRSFLGEAERKGLKLSTPSRRKAVARKRVPA